MRETSDLLIADPGVRAQCHDQVVALAGRDAAQVGLHHHREQPGRPAGAAPAAREERPAARGSAAPGRRSSWSRCAAATRCAARSDPQTFPGGGRDHRSELGGIYSYQDIANASLTTSKQRCCYPAHGLSKARLIITATVLPTTPTPVLGQGVLSTPWNRGI
jgi:hypothetical protein